MDRADPAPVPNSNTKFFVLDTNVVLHDSACIYQFKHHDLIIPITVIEELDKFKKGKGILNCNAREFLRALDALTGDRLFNGGVKIGPRNGKISIRLEQPFHEKLITNFQGGKPDHHILNTAYLMAVEKGFDCVVLVTKDVNLRMKAKSVGLLSEDYVTERLTDIADLYKGKTILEDVPRDMIDMLYQPPFEIDAAPLVQQHVLMCNEFLILKNGSRSALGIINAQTMRIRRIETRDCYGIKPRNAEQSFALSALLDRDIPLVTLSGKAGTGKTLLALAAALESRRFYRQIFVARPVVPLSNKDLGYLPGDVQSKLDPYMQPLYDNLAVIKNNGGGRSGQRALEEMLREDKIVITPLSYIRGRSIVKVFFIVDEAQNLTPHEVKTIITRVGEGTKLIFTGDIHQIDHPYLDSRSNGLTYLIERMKDQRLSAHIDLEKGERSELSDLAISIL